MGQIQSPKTFGGSGGGSGGAADLKTAESYLLGQSNVGISSAATDMSNGSIGNVFSQDPSIMASSWDLPPNLGALRLNTGNTQTTPVNAKTRTAVSSGVEMLNIYDKLDSGEKLTQADLNAASKLGPDIERAAQLQAAGKKNKAATTKAQNEIATRLAPTVGLTPETLGKDGLNSKVPPAFAATMQNAGYAVTKNMTVKQALGAAQSVVGGAAPPTSAQSNMTVSQYIQGLSSMSKGQLTQLQQNLYNGGFYDDTYYGGTDTTKGAEPKAYTQGVLDTGTMLAFRQAILQTLVDQKQGKDVTLDGVITGGASTNPALGNVPITSGLDQSASGPATPTISLATSAQTQDPLISAFTSALGRAPSQTELAAFTNSYNSQQEAGSTAAAKAGTNASSYVDPSTGLVAVPGTPSLSDSALQYAQNTNGTEYQAHNVANAFGMLMNLVDRAGTSSLDTPGTRPTTTT